MVDLKILCNFNFFTFLLKKTTVNIQSVTCVRQNHFEISYKT